MLRPKICVIGSGPVGTLTCLYICLNKPWDVTFIDTNHDREWINTFCMWEGEILGTWLWNYLENENISFVTKRWNYSAYTFPHDNIKLKQAYYMLDNQQLKSTVDRELCRRGVHFINGQINNLEERQDWIEVCLSNERYEPMRFDRIYNCSGHYTTIQEYDLNLTRRWQSCYGYFIKCQRSHYYDLDTATIMDWRECSINQQIHPSFCYILPLDKDTILFEETYIVTEKPVNTSLMHQTFCDRLDSLGIGEYDLIHKEIGSFPLGGGLPVNTSRIIALGAAGRWVNPATGYHLGYAIQQIPLAINGQTTVSKIKNFIYCLGGYVLMKLDYKSIVAFFYGFFKLQQTLFESYLWRTCHITDILRMKILLFLKLHWVVRFKVFFLVLLYFFNR